MPAPAIRHLLAGLTACALLGLGACGEKQIQNSTTAEMKDMEKVDGTINDAMTDLDGVRTETSAQVDISNASVASNSAKPAAASNTAEPDDSKAEVVAQQ